MYVCICNAVTDRQIRQAAAEGVSSLAELSDEVLLHVFKCGLAQGDLHNISLVCRYHI